MTAAAAAAAALRRYEMHVVHLIHRSQTISAPILSILRAPPLL